MIGAGRSEGGHGLAAVTDRHLGEIIDKTMQTSDWAGVLSQAQQEYAAKDAALLIPLGERLSAKLDELHLKEVANLEFECVLPVAAMELAGMVGSTVIGSHEMSVWLGARGIESIGMNNGLGTVDDMD